MEQNDIKVKKDKLDGIMPVRVCLSLGCQDTIKAKTFNSIVDTFLKSKTPIVSCATRQGGDIVSARTSGVKYARETLATHIFFFDSDMQFEGTTLDRLVAHDKDIITVEYNKRQLPLTSVTHPLTERSDTDLYKAIRIGAGCLLIKMSVFDKIDEFNNSKVKKGLKPDPYFTFGRDANGNVVMGEDTWFCNLSRDAGVDTWIDPTIKVGHIGEYLY